MPAIHRVLTVLVLIVIVGFSTGFAQPARQNSAKAEILTNESVLQLIAVGIDEDVIISKIQSSTHNFDLSVQGMVALKKGGVSDRLLHFMMNTSKPPESKTASPQSLAPPVVLKEEPKPVPAAKSEPVLPTELGVYAKRDDKWVEIQPEILNWKTGGVLKHIGTAGIVKGDVNGMINGAHSRNSVKAPMEFLVITAEGIAITEYQLIHLHEKDEAREFRTVTGGVLHASGGATRNLLQF
jgi:hypothetical protein